MTCTHYDCTCEVLNGTTTCSEHCAEQADMDHSAGDHTCKCGHSECDGTTN